MVLDTKVTVTSILPLPAAELWNVVGSLTGVNAEMAPWLKLVSFDHGRLEDARPHQPWPCRLRGPAGVPLGTYPLCFVDVPDEEGFLEQTVTGPFELWQHERRVHPDGPGMTTLTDALSWRLRAPFQRRRVDAAVAGGVRRFFEYRHRRLSASVSSHRV